MEPLTFVDLLAAAIRKGKSYHLFFGPIYFESYYYPETAKQAAENHRTIKAFGECRVVYLTCSKTVEKMK